VRRLVGFNNGQDTIDLYPMNVAFRPSAIASIFSLSLYLDDGSKSVLTGMKYERKKKTALFVLPCEGNVKKTARVKTEGNIRVSFGGKRRYQERSVNR
jgi:hypothetical protein